MADRVLSNRELNRALLERQWLLARRDATVAEGVANLVALQAQIPAPPFIGLWTRIQRFAREDLAREVQERSIVRATMLRGTIHLLTAADFVRFRTTLQPVLDAGQASIMKQRGASFDEAEVVEAGRAFLGEAPHTFAELTRMLEERYPGIDAGALRYTIRMRLPMVQFPEQAAWTWPSAPKFTPAVPWLATEMDPGEYAAELFQRYLSAFGPASPRDFQVWSGLPLAKEAVDALRPSLVTYRDEKKRELFDLPGMEVPQGDVAAPIRFLPEFDNIVMSHFDRTRVVANEHRKAVYLPALRVAATVLVDGFVGGTWRYESTKKASTFTVTTFSPLPVRARDEAEEEAKALARFIEPAATSPAVAFASA